ncbi:MULTISPECIES: zinc-dependent alcohol dehydrogenase [unclassified Micromonospora]|uniref:zinc-dependent alcohol dehydrogenase n=1 Tax=unclassified Micromonospora TaxID=2617518 RepID=UPI002FF2093F
MKANCWVAPNKLAVEDVPDPQILNPRDAVVRVTSSAICGSDLHLLDGFIPAMKRGDILGHEFMGEIVELGQGARDGLRVGDRVVVGFPIACGDCFSCQRGLYSACENSNPNAAIAEVAMGHSPGGIFGYSHLLGGYAGGQAEYVRVPYVDVGAVKIEDDLPDEKVLFLGDVLPTGYMAAELCEIKPGDVVAIWGAGPVGQFAAVSAYLLGAGQVIVIDRYPYRLRMARDKVGAETINYEESDVLDTLREMTAGRGPDACIDAVGMEGHHASAALQAYDRAKQAMKAESDRPHALREAILSCRNGGTISAVGSYGGFIDKFPMGSLMNRSLTMRSGQAHVQRFMRPLLERIRKGEIDPSFIITHTMGIDDAPLGYDIFKNKQDECMKVVLKA